MYNYSGIFLATDFKDLTVFIILMIKDLMAKVLSY